MIFVEKFSVFSQKNKPVPLRGMLLTSGVGAAAK